MNVSEKKLSQVNISCVIATHNRDDFLKEAVHSVNKQTYAPLEIIIVNDIPKNQTKKTVEILSKTSIVPIQYIEHEMGANGRGSISKNLAAPLCKGEFIAFLDDDDLWETNYLEKMSSIILKNNSKITYSGTCKIKNNKKTPYKQLKRNLGMKDLILTNPGCQVSNLIVEKKLFIGLGGFDDYVVPSNDKDFLIRALYFGFKYDVLNEKLVIQNKHDGDQITDANNDFLIGMKKFYKKHEWVATPSIKLKFWLKYWKLYIKILFSKF
jgi:glycosyltransferase involved in cell wall biosynthesis